MAGVTDPRDASVDPVEPDFDFEEKTDSDEYVPILIALLQGFYKRYKGKDPNFILKNIDKDVDQLHQDMEAVIDQKVPEVYQLGAAGAVASAMEVAMNRSKDLKKDAENTLKKAAFKKVGIDKKGSKKAVGIEYPMQMQKFTLQGVTDEIRNDMTSSAYYVGNRLDKEQNLEVKSGNIVNRATNRIKAMGMEGSRAAFAAGMFAILETVFVIESTKWNWNTMQDENVCSYCDFFEMSNPWDWDELPPCPYHDWCRCWVTADTNTAEFSAFTIGILPILAAFATGAAEAGDEDDSNDEGDED